jgi:hypothetical protein
MMLLFSFHDVFSVSLQVSEDVILEQFTSMLGSKVC